MSKIVYTYRPLKKNERYATAEESVNKQLALFGKYSIDDYIQFPQKETPQMELPPQMEMPLTPKITKPLPIPPKSYRRPHKPLPEIPKNKAIERKQKIAMDIAQKMMSNNTQDLTAQEHEMIKKELGQLQKKMAQK